MARKKKHNLGKFGIWISAEPCEITNHSISWEFDFKKKTVVLVKPGLGMGHLWWVKLFRVLRQNGFTRIQKAETVKA